MSSHKSYSRLDRLGDGTDLVDLEEETVARLLLDGDEERRIGAEKVARPSPEKREGSPSLAERVPRTGNFDSDAVELPPRGI